MHFSSIYTNLPYFPEYKLQLFFMVWLVMRLILRCDLYIKLFTVVSYSSERCSRLVCQYLLLLKISNLNIN